MRNVVLFGFMGTGKTVAGREVARRLGMKFVDMDDIIEEKEGCAISEIFAEKGEEHFRGVESKVARDLAQEEGLVIATGGGVVLNPENVDALQASGTGICLTASPKITYERVKGKSHRPLLMTDDPLDRIESLLRYRAPFYKSVKYRIDTSALSVEGVIRRIVEIVTRDRESQVEARGSAEETLDPE